MNTLTPSRFSPETPDGFNATRTSPLAPNGVVECGKLYEVPARQGRAIRLNAGDHFRIINTFGSQVADFWAFNAPDLQEFLSMEHLRASTKRIAPRPGDALVTNRRRPILTLLEDSSPGVHDTMIAACDVHRYHQLGHEGYHDNCTDNLRMSLLAIELAAPRIPCPLNFWMNTPPQSDGAIKWLSPASRPGDHIDMRAEQDCIVVISACPMDILPINGESAEPHALHCMRHQPDSTLHRSTES